MRDKISVIVPCFNEEACIDEFYRETQKVAEEMRVKEGADYELLFVDDGSRDGTLDCLRRISQADLHCRFISFSRNFGKEAAMYAGLNEATGNFAVFMDADLQHSPALLPQMYKAVKSGEYDCCGGKRKGRDGDGKLRAFLSRGFYKICKALTGLNTNDGEGDFRMMNRQVMDAILSLHECGRYTKGIFSFVGFRTKWIEFENVERKAGESKWNLRALLGYAADGILTFSTAPLRLAGALAVLLALSASAAFISAIFTKELHMIGAALLFICSAMQMLMFYIFGLYFAHAYKEIKARPVYIVRERSNR